MEPSRWCMCGGCSEKHLCDLCWRPGEELVSNFKVTVLLITSHSKNTGLFGMNSVDLRIDRPSKSVVVYKGSFSDSWITEFAPRAADANHLSPPLKASVASFSGGGKVHARSRRRELPTAGGKISHYPTQPLSVNGTAVGGAMRHLRRSAHRSTPRQAV